MTRNTKGRISYDSRKKRESTKKRIGKKKYRFILERDEYKCAYCESEVNLQLDHLIPRSKGGKDEVTNLVISCRSCNSSRRNMNLTAWSRYAFIVKGLVFNPRTIRRRAKKNEKP